MKHYKPGDRYGRLVIQQILSHPKNPRARCLCDCGVESSPQLGALGNGRAQSCGCLRLEKVAQVGRENATHGYSHTPTYQSWLDCRDRCYRPANKRYSEYGGRGITVCERWRHSFANFLADMGEAPPGMTMERDDVHGDYEPSNCRWATRLDQARNKRVTKGSMEIARVIRSKHASGATLKAMANEFGMSQGNVSFIVAGVTWKEQ